MIFVSNVESVNGPGLVHLTREQLWAGLVMKANNALPFVPAMQSCEVIERHSDVSFDRNIVLRGQPHTERIVLEGLTGLFSLALQVPFSESSPTKSWVLMMTCNCVSASL